MIHRSRREMGQALRRAKPPVTVRTAARNPVPVPPKDVPVASETNPSRATDSGAAEAALLRASREKVAGSSRQNSEVKPQPPEPRECHFLILAAFDCCRIRSDCYSLRLWVVRVNCMMHYEVGKSKHDDL